MTFKAAKSIFHVQPVLVMVLVDNLRWKPKSHFGEVHSEFYSKAVRKDDVDCRFGGFKLPKELKDVDNMVRLCVMSLF